MERMAERISRAKLQRESIINDRTGIRKQVTYLSAKLCESFILEKNH